MCTGYGGLDLGVLAAFGGGRIARCSDPGPHIAAILAERMPGVPNHGDVLAIDWTAVEPVEVLTAGFPCQDISAAGRRAGIENRARSGLWTDIVADLRLLRPTLLVVENVAAPRWRRGGLHRVLGDLAEAGDDTAWRSVRAADIGAAHRREWVFLLYLDTFEICWSKFTQASIGRSTGHEGQVWLVRVVGVTGRQPDCRGGCSRRMARRRRPVAQGRCCGRSASRCAGRIRPARPRAAGPDS